MPELTKLHKSKASESAVTWKEVIFQLGRKETYCLHLHLYSVIQKVLNFGVIFKFFLPGKILSLFTLPDKLRFSETTPNKGAWQ